MNTETQLTTIPGLEAEREQLSSHSLLLRPASDINDIVQSWATYQELKTRLLDSSDWQNIAGRNCIKKSGWRKLQTAFGISDEIVEEKRIECDGYFTYETTVKVSASNSRYSFGVGSCSSNERRFTHPEHDTRSTAHTRAKNRAISDLIGGGEVSAEEMITSNETPANASYESKDEQVSYVETIVGKQQDYAQNKTGCSGKEMSVRQRDYLISLINSKTVDAEERERQLAHIENIDKAEASSWIHDLCAA